MKRFRENMKGAVTVIVTLMLIPSVLLLGTSVDVSRIYSAKSVVQDANSLAANSALASYDALLQDLYGLYAMKDPALNSMIADYLKVAVYGDGKSPQGMGTYQLTYGNSESLTYNVAVDQTLENEEVIRRQIEEYMTLRAPIVIVEKVMSVIQQLNQTAADAKAIQQKMEIEERIEEIEKIYKEIYEQIKLCDGYVENEKAVIGNVNYVLDKISYQFVVMRNTRKKYMDCDDEERKKDFENKYRGLFHNIESYAYGGDVYLTYSDGYYTDDGDFEQGEWLNPRTIQKDDTLNERGNSGQGILKFYKSECERLAMLLDIAEGKKSELKAKLQEFKSQLNNCSDSLREGVTEQKSYGGKTLIELYESMLEYDLSKMSDKICCDEDSERVTNCKRIEGLIEEFDFMGYGERYNSNANTLESIKILSTSNLRNLFSQFEEFQIDYLSKNTRGKDILTGRPSYSDCKFEFKSVEYVEFEKLGQQEKEFYNMLKNLSGGSDDDSQEESVRGSLNDVLKYIKSLFDGLVDEPEGAYYYKYNGGSGEATGLASGEGWSDDEITDTAKSALNSNILKDISGILDDATNKILLVTYDVEMFSHYATNKPVNSGKKEESLTGVPFNTTNNYYYQSELEYLYNGDKNSALKNLSAVKGSLLLIRFVCNYVVSFSITSVNNTVSLIESIIPFPVNFIVGELARLVIALGESAIDVSQLRNGKKVPFFKDNNTWQLSIEGIIKGTVKATENIIKSAANTSLPDDEKGVDYATYMTLLLFLKDGDTLADRTRSLIELNLTAYLHRGELSGLTNNGSRENKMASIEPESFSKYVTGFTITTSADIDMLFLRMNAAQNGIGGVIPPKVYTVKESLSRGY